MQPTKDVVGRIDRAGQPLAVGKSVSFPWAAQLQRRTRQGA